MATVKDLLVQVSKDTAAISAKLDAIASTGVAVDLSPVLNAVAEVKAELTETPAA